MKVIYALVMLGLVACAFAKPAELSDEEKKLAANFGFQDGQTPPPGALAGPAGPAEGHVHPQAAADEAAKLASNFGFKEGQTPPPGALASPSKPTKH